MARHAKRRPDDEANAFTQEGVAAGRVPDSTRAGSVLKPHGGR